MIVHDRPEGPGLSSQGRQAVVSGVSSIERWRRGTMVPVNAAPLTLMFCAIAFPASRPGLLTVGPSGLEFSR